MQIEEMACPNCGSALPGDFTPNQQLECEHCGSMFLATGLEAETALICPQCRTINPPDQRYCSSCGTGLKEDCVLCHTANRAGTVYCANCGAHLAHARFRRDRVHHKRKEHRAEMLRILEAKEARQTAEKLEQLLVDLDEPENHDFAIYQINRLGIEAISALIETLLHDEDPDARYGSARALGQICNEHEVKGLIKARAAKSLIVALNDPQPAVRYWAVDALGCCQTQAAVEPLIAMLEDSHAGIRNHARLVLAGIGGERIEQVLAKFDKKGVLGWVKRS